ncbi:MAG: response regulator [Proteobacteria bacterium]|nr:response regulator [Pseudomonadota bacterium]MBU1710953.1 response regulator [Pseudomonadota bacterium]
MDNKPTSKLTIIIIMPIIVLLEIMGGCMYYYLQQNTNSFIKYRITREAERHHNDIYSLITDHYNQLLIHEPTLDAAKIHQAETISELEIYFSLNGLTGQIFENSSLLYSINGPVSKPGYPENYAQTYSEYYSETLFAPWNWEISVIENPANYQRLRERITQGLYLLFASYTILAIAIIVLLWRLVLIPLKQIITPLRNNQLPQYKGIDEFEFLSNTIASDIQKRQEVEERLIHHQVNLEKTVSQRTQELEEEILCREELLKTLKSRDAQLAVSQTVARLGSWEWDILSNKVTFSEELFRLLGLNSDDDVPTYDGLLQRVHADDRDGFAQEIKRALHEKQSYRMDVKMVRADGTQWIMEGRGSVTTDDQGSPLMLTSTAQDITERKLMRDALHKKQKSEAIGTLSAGIAHDFNNVLNMIYGYLEVINNNISKTDANYENFQGITLSCNRASELVKQILIYSRHDEQDKRPVLLQPIIAETLQLHEISVPDNIEFQIHVDSSCRAIDANVTQIQQVCLNLLQNACQAMATNGGILRIELSEVEITNSLTITNPRLIQGETYARLTVSDTGQGMDNDTLEKIFNPYFTTKTFSLGTGLGLAITHGIIENNHGAIIVESAPGKGSTFHVFLPLSKQPLELEKLTSAARPMEASDSKHILFIDDEKLNTQVWSIALTQAGFQVTTETDARNALRLFKAAPDHFDIVITDQRMPELTGIELAGELIKIRADLPIILTSGWDDSMDFEKVKNVKGIRKVISKPHTMDVLLQAISSCLE